MAAFLKERLCAKKDLSRPIQGASPDLAIATVCADFVRLCRRDDDALRKLVTADVLLGEEAVHIKSAKTDGEWALRLWSSLSVMGWTTLAKATHYMPASLRTMWREWIALYDTSKEVPHDNRQVEADTGRDPKWYHRQGLVENMFVTPQLIASLISRGLLTHARYNRHAEALLLAIENDKGAWTTAEELHHNMRNALYEAHQDDAAHCV
jgi:hypothetical protein